MRKGIITAIPNLSYIWKSFKKSQNRYYFNIFVVATVVVFAFSVQSIFYLDANIYIPAVILCSNVP